MFNPLQRLKYLPWLQLFQVAGLVAIIARVIDGVLAIALLQLQANGTLNMGSLLRTLGIVFTLLSFGSAVGIGALGITVMERWFRQISINAAIIWALTACLTLVLFLLFLLPPPGFLVGISYQYIIFIVLGAAVKGRRYWR